MIARGRPCRNESAEFDGIAGAWDSGALRRWRSQVCLKRNPASAGLSGPTFIDTKSALGPVTAGYNDLALSTRAQASDVEALVSVVKDEKPRHMLLRKPVFEMSA